MPIKTENFDKEDKEYLEKNELSDMFSSKRTDRCLELMKPEVRALVDLPLDQKVAKSKEIIREAVTRFQNPCLGFSGGTDSLVALHMALQVKPDLSVIFVDTIREFPENYQFVQEVREKWGITDFVVVRRDKDRRDEFAAKLGYKTPEFMLQYCNDHKIVPMLEGLRRFHFDAMIAGVRGVEHEERAQESLFSPRRDPDHYRVHPMLFWKRNDVMEYVSRNQLKCNPLYSQGYTSLGCTICSAVNTDPNAHERAGRGIVREVVMKRLRALGYN
jgi:phosphoadenosine phosphosulfate reductase